MVIAPTTLVMASTKLSRLNKLFNCLLSCRALFILAFILVISAAWASILFCLCLELWDRCSGSPLSTAAIVTFVLACCFPQLLNIRANLPLNWVKVLESGEDKHCPLAITQKYGSLKFWVYWCFNAWLASLINSGFQAMICLTRICNSSAKASSVSLVFWNQL